MKPGEQRKAEGLQSLADYIAENHGGNNAAFGRTIAPDGVERHQVQQWLNAKKPVYVLDGKLVQVIRDLDSAS